MLPISSSLNFDVIEGDKLPRQGRIALNHLPPHFPRTIPIGDDYRNVRDALNAPSYYIAAIVKQKEDYTYIDGNFLFKKILYKLPRFKQELAIEEEKAGEREIHGEQLNHQRWISLLISLNEITDLDIVHEQTLIEKVYWFAIPCLKEDHQISAKHFVFHHINFENIGLQLNVLLGGGFLEELGFEESELYTFNLVQQFISSKDEKNQNFGYALLDHFCANQSIEIPKEELLKKIKENDVPCYLLSEKKLFGKASLNTTLKKIKSFLGKVFNFS